MKSWLNFTFNLISILLSGVFSEKVVNRSDLTQANPTSERAAEAHIAPWIISLVRKGGSFFCAGSLIKNDWILTAGSCLALHNQKPDDLEAIAGEYDIEWDDGTEQLRFVNDFVIHPNMSLGLNDIGLVHVSKPFDLNEFVQEVQLGAAFNGEATLHTWIFKGNSLLTKLREIDFRIIPDNKCVEELHVSFGSGIENFCTAYLKTGDPGGCKGITTGSPLVQDSVLIGISTTIQVPCEKLEQPKVFTRVSTYMDWINITMNTPKELSPFNQHNLS